MVLQLVVCSEPHPSPRIDRIEKALREVRVDRPRQVEGCRAAPHDVGVREDVSLLVGELPPVFHGEDHDPPQPRAASRAPPPLAPTPPDACNYPPLRCVAKFWRAESLLSVGLSGFR